MNSKAKVFSNLVWRFFERCGAQLVSLAVSILLARLLAPELYGLVSKVVIITSILMVFVDSGMANALIQKKDPDDLDFSSVFYFNVAFCLVLYGLLFLFSPLIARMYHSPELVPILRVLGLTVVVSGVKNVQQAYVSKTLQFKRFFFATLGGTLFSAALGIFMALRGFGVWALVAQQLSNVTVNTLILWFTVGWRPKAMFSLQRLKGLLSYGWKLLGAQLLDTIYLRLYPMIVGIRYTDADLAFQIYQTQKAVNLALGVDYNMHFLRIYEGLAQNDLRTHQYLVQLGNYKGIASFNVDGNEKAQTLKKLQSGLKSGNIYAFNCNADSVAKLKEFIPYAVSKGYELVTLNDLLGYEKNEVAALEGEAMDALIPEPLPFVYQNYVLLGGKERPQGYAVQLLQQRLIELGYLSKDSRVDGDYGPNTKLAVQLFQQQMGLSTDGYAGVETQKLLFSEGAEPNRGTRVAGQN